MSYSQPEENFGPPAFLLLRVAGSYVVCQSIVAIEGALDESVQHAVDDLFATRGVNADICQIPPPTGDDQGVAYLQAKIQAVPVPRPGGG